MITTPPPTPPQNPPPDPRHVIFSLDSGLDRSLGGLWASQNTPNPTIFHADDDQPNAQDSTDYILKIYAAHVAQNLRKNPNFRVDEMLICGHGVPFYMCARDGKQRLNIKDLLASLESSELPLPKRLVFAGCSIFTNLDHGDVNRLSAFAKRHNVELVGTTSIAAAGAGLECGDWVCFKPDGTIVRDDKEHTPLGLHDVYKPLFTALHYAYGAAPPSDAWLRYYLDKTPEEGLKAAESDLAIAVSLRIKMGGINQNAVMPVQHHLQDIESIQKICGASIAWSEDRKRALIYYEGNSHGLEVNEKGSVRLSKAEVEESRNAYYRTYNKISQLASNVGLYLNTDWVGTFEAHRSDKFSWETASGKQSALIDTNADGIISPVEEEKLQALLRKTKEEIDASQKHKQQQRAELEALNKNLGSGLPAKPSSTVVHKELPQIKK